MDEEIYLRRIIEPIVRYKRLVIVLFLVSVVITGILSFFVLPKVYEATCSLLIGTDQTKANINVSTSVDALVNPLLFVNISVNSSKEIIQGDDFLRIVYEKLPDRDNSYDISFESFRKMVKVSNPTNTSIIKISVYYKDPVIAQNIAETLLDEAYSYISQLYNQGAERNRKDLENQLSIAKTSLETAQKALAEFDSQSENLEKLSREKANYVDALNSYLSQYLTLDWQIKHYQALLNETKIQLSKESKFLTLRKTILDDPLVSQIAQDLSNEKILDLLKLSVTSEEINPIYEDLRNKEESYSITLAGLIAKKATLENLIKITEDKIHSLTELIEQKQLQRNELERRVILTQGYYNNISSLYLNASVKANSFVAISEKPIVPEKPVKPRKILNIAIAGIVSLFLGVIIAFFADYWNKSKNYAREEK